MEKYKKDRGREQGRIILILVQFQILKINRSIRNVNKSIVTKLEWENMVKKQTRLIFKKATLDGVFTASGVDIWSY